MPKTSPIVHNTALESMTQDQLLDRLIELGQRSYELISKREEITDELARLAITTELQELDQQAAAINTALNLD